MAVLIDCYSDCIKNKQNWIRFYVCYTQSTLYTEYFKIRIFWRKKLWCIALLTVSQHNILLFCEMYHNTKLLPIHSPIIFHLSKQVKIQTQHPHPMLMHLFCCESSIKGLLLPKDSALLTLTLTVNSHRGFINESQWELWLKAANLSAAVC